MRPHAEQEQRPIHKGIFLLILFFALSQPVVCLWPLAAPPEGAVATGLHIPDSALFLYSMRMADTELGTPYATCGRISAQRGLPYYAVPHLWLYGALGAAARMLHLSDLVVYAVANGLGTFLYLLAAYLLLLSLMPAYANLTFLLFTLSGGAAGILYLATGVLGLHAHPAFELYFLRWGLYELFEGPHLLPVTQFPRFYYTLSLAFLFGGLSGLVSALRGRRPATLLLWSIPLVAGAFINARYGIFVAGVGWLFCALDAPRTRARRFGAGLLFSAPILGGALLSAALMRQNPSVIENHLQVANMAMWFSPFVLAIALHACIACRPLFRAVGALPRWGRILGSGAVGYLCAYAALYLAHQIFHGNLLTGRDGSVAAAVSDRALLGAALGALLGNVLPHAKRAAGGGGYALWFLLMSSLAISGFGDGWFLRFGPQRLTPLLWLPLCALTAAGLRQMQPWPRRAILSVLLACGIASSGVALFKFQSPWGRLDAKGPFPALHAEIMSDADAKTMAAVRPGTTVLSTAPASDIFALRLGCRVVFGVGSFNLTDCDFVTLRDEVNTFFSPGTPDHERKKLADRWKVAYVYCPDTWPIPEQTLRELRSASWLTETASDGCAVLFRVAPPEGGTPIVADAAATDTQRTLAMAKSS